MNIIDKVNEIAEATVGSPDNNLQLDQHRRELEYRHNQFMSLTSDRFTSLLQSGKIGNYHQQKQKVEQGLSKIYFLLDRLN
jgi:hypothetical protein